MILVLTCIVFREPYYSDSDSSSASCKSRKSSKQEHGEIYRQPTPEMDISMTSVPAQSFQSCEPSLYDQSSSSQGSGSTSGSTSTATSAMSSRRRRRHRKRRHQGPPSALMIFIQNFLENFGQAFTEFFLYLCSVIKVNSNGSVRLLYGLITNKKEF